MIVFSITDAPDQKFATVLNGRRASVRLRYNPSTDRWSFDLSIDGRAVLHGRRIVPGTDLLAAYNFGIGIIFGIGDYDAAPNRQNLPNGSFQLYHTTDAELAALQSDATVS